MVGIVGGNSGVCGSVGGQCIGRFVVGVLVKLSSESERATVSKRIVNHV